MTAYVTFSQTTEPKAFDIEATFALTYRLASDLSEEDLTAFAKVNAVFNAYPYWRELFSSTTSRFGFQPPPVPLMKI